jgi:Icc-related predicted phosphoesterase
MTPDFFKEYWAFNAARGQEIRNYWSMIPKNVDVLITHGPAKGILDLLENGIDHVGCEELEYTVNYELSDLKLHVFGHIHSPHGKYTNDRGTTFVNASTCTEEYAPINMPMQVHL